jgi:hypothetical protein
MSGLSCGETEGTDGVTAGVGDPGAGACGSEGEGLAIGATGPVRGAACAGFRDLAKATGAFLARAGLDFGSVARNT